VSRSPGVGLLAGGAQRTAAVIQAPRRARPSPACREVGWVQSGEQEVARAVAGEHAPGAVRAVRRGRQAEDQDPGGGIAEARDRAPPVLLAGERRPLLARDALAPLDQPRARAAADDLRLEGLKRAGGHRA
jgi:hypothetical protein